MKSIKVKYFAMFREKAQIEIESLDVECETYRDLYLDLARRHDFPLPVEMVQVAVNDEFAQLDDTISQNARVVFIPPVAGG